MTTFFVLAALVSGFITGSWRRRSCSKHHEPRAIHLQLPERCEWVETTLGEDVLSLCIPAVPPPPPAWPDGPIRMPVAGPRHARLTLAVRARDLDTAQRIDDAERV